MKRWLKRLICSFRQHTCVETGRRGYTLHEWQCDRCGARLVTSDDHGGAYIVLTPSSEAEFEEIFARYRAQEKGKQCL